MSLDGLRERLRREDGDAASVGEKVPLQFGIDYDPYELIDPAAVIPAQPESMSEKKQVKEEAAQIERNNIIKNFGMFWSRADVDWKSMNMYGAQRVDSPIVNFKEQCGVYLLHDAREVIYVGQAVKQPISKRLADHCKDRLSGRWDRFSWFGFYGVNDGGKLIQDDFQNINFTIENLADTLEAILIEGLEPRQNRQTGKISVLSFFKLRIRRWKRIN